MTIVRVAVEGGPLLQKCWLALELKPPRGVPGGRNVPELWFGESAQSTSNGSAAEPDESAKEPPEPLPLAVTA